MQIPMVIINQCMWLLSFLLLFKPIVGGVVGMSCPHMRDLQDPSIKEAFNLTKFEGLWYELAYKDLTQPRFCRCMTSNKVLKEEEAFVADAFNIECVGKIYSNDLRHYLTSDKGIFKENWANFSLPFIANFDIPNAVMAVDDIQAEEYGWVIEFQCIEVKSQVVFIGINYYSRTSDNSILQKMIEAARYHGLGPYLDVVRPIHMVDHENCQYDENIQN